MTIRTHVATVALLGGLAACGGGDGDKAADQPAAPTDTGAAGATITMRDNSFSPAALTVAPGTKIAVINKGQSRHNLTDKKSIDSGDVNGGGAAGVVAPTAPGEYAYKCIYHPGMVGTLTVK